MTFYQKHQSLIRHVWISGTVFGGATLVIHVLVLIMAGNQLPWLLDLANTVIYLPTYWLLQDHGIVWSSGAASGLPLLTLLVMMILNASIGTLCWIICRAFWLGLRPFFIIR